MPLTKTPLRYPGGKSKLYNFMINLLQHNQLTNCIYVEPFVGGAGLALALLLNGKVREIVINDFDYSIYAFWYCVLNRTDELVGAIAEIPVTIDEWLKQREIQKEPEQHDIFEVAMSTFFLNRVNRSGIIKGGVIGGLQQTGNYKLDCRFNKKNLIAKIRIISDMKEKIRLYNMDVKDFIPNVINGLADDSLIYFDPPYILQGSNLYCNFFTKQDHEALSELIKNVRLPWVLTYDNEPIVYDMYKEFEIQEINLKYSAGSKRGGIELMVFSKTISPLITNKIEITKA